MRVKQHHTRRVNNPSLVECRRRQSTYPESSSGRCLQKDTVLIWLVCPRRTYSGTGAFSPFGTEVVSCLRLICSMAAQDLLGRVTALTRHPRRAEMRSCDRMSDCSSSMSISRMVYVGTTCCHKGKLRLSFSLRGGPSNTTAIPTRSDDADSD